MHNNPIGQLIPVGTGYWAYHGQEQLEGAEAVPQVEAPAEGESEPAAA